MPEGPEIAIMAEELNSLLKKSLFLKLKCKKELFHSDYELKNDKFKISEICKRIKSFGKKIIFIFETFSFISSCLMDGRWKFEKGNGKIIIEMLFRDKNNNEIKVYYEDSSNRGFFSIVDKNSDNFSHILKDVGPDYMNEDVDFEMFYEKISRPRISNKQIQDFLMDQKEFSGIGNYLKSEILYGAKILPTRELSSISHNKFKKLFKKIKKIMYESYRCGGLTIATYKSPSGKIGTFEPKVYSKDEDELGNKVLTILDRNKRKTYFVPEIQK